MTPEELIGDWLVIGSAVLAVACPVAFQWTTRGAWRDTAIGWHLMSFMLAIAAVLVQAAIRLVCDDFLGVGDPVWFQRLRVAVFVSIPIVLAWRLVEILRPYRTPSERREDTIRKGSAP